MRAGGVLPALLIVFASAVLQASTSDDIYWEGEEDGSNEFLEVKEDSLIQRVKRDFFSFNPLDIFASPSTTTTPPPALLEVNTDNPDDTDDRYENEGSGYQPLQVPTEKTIRVSFVVVEPYNPEYSNRDSAAFQEFSKSLASAVDEVLEVLPGKQKANLVRIQSLTNDEISCNVTLDITTTGYDDTVKIAKTLENHIKSVRHLRMVAVQDKGFIATYDPDLCNPGEISCEDGRGCFFETGRCNGIPDCLDQSDEADCPSVSDTWDSQLEDKNTNQPPVNEFDQAPVTAPNNNNDLNELGPEETTTERDYPDSENTVCAPDEIVCDVTRCITRDQLCNGRQDCYDNFDEANCKNKSCGVDDFRCDNGQCLPSSVQCNRVLDCIGGEDEINCPCIESEFQCRSDLSCLEKRKRCDGTPDCPDGSDEEDCTSGETVDVSAPRRSCRADQYTCPLEDGVCGTRCDGNPECANGEDEEGCEDDCSHYCDGRCLDDSKICDHVPDCSDSSDEENCSACDGPSDFRCNDGTCLNIALRCNNLPECPDRSDEENCDKIMKPGSESCTVREFTCADGSCIGSHMYCDGHNDCNDNSDEIDCQYQIGCTADQFQCNSGRCVPVSRYCDTIPDCDDGSDEPSDCPDYPYTTGYPYPRPTTRYTPPPFTTQLPPRINNIPYPTTSRPVFTTSPPFYGPRVPAGPVALNLKTYPNEDAVRNAQYPTGGDVVFQCRDEGPLRAPVRWIREGGRPLKPGSVDKKGRLEMYQVSVQDSGSYVCQAPAYLQYPGSEVRVQLTVNRQTQIAPRPYPECKPHEATCSNGQCIPKSAVCNGIPDCVDNSDEDSCHRNGVCEPNQFECRNRKCVLKTWICDSDDDCGDNSDEEDCSPVDPSQSCLAKEFTCTNITQCIPKSFHCDGPSDCQDGTDEVGCLAILITKLPSPPEVHLKPGDTLTLECQAYGVPTPLISWRLNWGHVPAKCSSTSVNGLGTLVCPDMQPEDSGAYSCEGLNNRGSSFASRDSIVFVERTDICPDGYFNKEARTTSECIRCFCFGESLKCKSADLYVYNMPTPLGDGGTRLLGIKIDPYLRDVSVDPHPITNQYHYDRNERLRNGATITKVENYGSFVKSDSKPYLALPESYNGNQLKSYGGQISYRYSPHTTYGNFYENAIIIKGKYETLIYVNNPTSREPLIQARLVPGLWRKVSPRGLEPATREDIMMALDDVELILLRAEANNGGGVTITDFKMESAQLFNVQLGSASLVEECTCPPGYEGLSCQKCASGYTRQSSGNPWLGSCVADQLTCPPRTYDPGNGRGCLPCPCPFTCTLAGSGEVVCNCPPGYQGAHCQSCSPGYTGNPLIPGDGCRPEVSSNCNPAGTALARGDDCECKENAQGRYCDQCKPDYFYLSEDFSQGCARCFCSGVTNNCRSSNLRRVTIHTALRVPQVADQVKIYITDTPYSNDNTYRAAKETDLKPYSNEGEVTIYDLTEPSSVYYWSLPLDFAGDKVTSYGGYLRYSLRYEGRGQVASQVPDVQLISKSSVYSYYGSFAPQDGFLNGTVPLIENGWKRPDGNPISREFFLIALADVKTILVRASYTSTTSSASLVSASIDIARPDGFGAQALHVEQCDCPPGYTGTSCEDCAAGYTRTDTGIYLHDCVRCNCSGHSDMCDPDTGVCSNCRDNTAGNFCEECKPGYTKDAYDNCVLNYGTPPPSSDTCSCDPRGSEGSCDVYGACHCKRNVQGERCDSCRPGTFGLGYDDSFGCLSCYCSGVSSECYEARNFQRTFQAAPMLGSDYGGYTIQNLHADRVINDDFVSIPGSSELLYTFNFPPNDEDLYWSLPVFTGNRLLSYGGTLSFGQKFELGGNAGVSNSGTDVIIIGGGLSLYWSNPNQFQSGTTYSYSVPMSENGWYVLNSVNRATREDFLTVLKNVDRILVRATLAPDLVSTSISDVWMHYALESSNPTEPPKGVEVCLCPEGYQGTSCESCSSNYYKDQYGRCQQCNCNGHDCQLVEGSVVCNCRPPYVGPDCVSTDDRVRPNITRPQPPKSSGIRVIIKEPTIKIHEIGSTVNFTCEAHSRRTTRPLRVTWSKINGFLPRGRSQIDERNGQLLITNVHVSDSGRYMCQTTDGVATDQAYTTLTVPSNSVVLPIVSILPNTRLIQNYEGDLIQLSCTATGTPTPTINWSRVEQRPLRGESYDGNYIIDQAREDDSGEYRCVASNAGGYNERTISIVVRPRPSRPKQASLTVYPKEPEVQEGQITKVVCTGTTEVPAGSIEWTRQDGVSLSENVRSNNGVLTVNNANVADEGVYICQSSSLNVPYATVYLRVLSTGPPNPEDRPNVTTSVRNLTIPTGESGSLDCTPHGYPLPRIRWSKSGGEFGPGTSQRGNTLLISQALESDSGYYQCDGLVGDEPYTTVYVYVEIERREKPRVEIWPRGEQAITLGEKFRLQCLVEGYPEPLVSWHHHKGLSPRTNIQPNNVLLFENFDVNDEGEYTCNAYNAAGSANASVYLKAHSSPEITLKPGNDIELIEGQPLSIECRGNGYPRPEVSIETTDGVVLAQPNQEKAIYRVNTATERDSGFYICKAWSPAGVREEQIRVNVQARRGDIGFEEGSGEYEFNPDDERPRTKLVGVGQSTNMSCTNSAGYRVIWSREDRRPLQPNAVQRGNELVIAYTTKNDGGLYECTLYNIDTNEAQQNIITNLRVLAPVSVTLQPPSQTVRPGQTATVECIVDGDDISLIQWTPVNKPFSSNIEVRDSKLIFHNIEVEDAGYYECFARNEVSQATNKAEVVVSDKESPVLVSIEQPNRSFYTGENLNVVCRANSRGVTVSWEKLGTREFIDSKLTSNGAILTLSSVSSTDAAVYRCTGRDAYGRISSEDFTLDVIPGEEAPKDDQYTTYSARLGHYVDIPCNLNSDLPAIEWRRPYGQIAPGVRSNEPYLRLENLSEQDAGIYICRATDGRNVQESKVIVRVDGIVPRFDGESWISLPTLKDSFKQFDIKIAFKPREDDGLILYNSQSPDRFGDFIALQLIRGVPQFILNTGGEDIITLTGNQPLGLNTWHTVRISKKNTEVSMDVDSGQHTTTHQTHPYEILELAQPLYIGGVPDLDQLPAKLAGANGFIGCVSLLQLAKEDVNIMAESIDKSNINECDSCQANPCRNNGVCQESSNENGFICICTGGYGGLYCDRQGESCQPGLCGQGKCTNIPDGYKCTCPGAFTGRNCEIKQSIEYPAFTGSAYLAIDPPKESRVFTMSMKIRATAPVTDGIIMYSAESDSGQGAFISLAVRNGRIEFQFYLGDGTEPVVLTSNKPLPANELTDIRINRSGALVSLEINGQVYEKILESPKKSLYLNTPMYVGGVDDSVILNERIGRLAGFRGCIKDVVLLESHVDIVRKSIQSENVRECGNQDRGDIPENESVCPCHNGGRCNVDGICECPYGFIGQYCQTRVLPDPCLSRPCRNGGSCRQDNGTKLHYACDCPLGYGGYNCQMTLNLMKSVAFNGNGYLTLPGHLLNYDDLDREDAVIALAFLTTRDGVLMYQGERNVAPNYGDFVLIRIEDGKVLIEWNLGSGKATLTADDVIVADGHRHAIIAKLTRGNQVSLSVDGIFKSGESVGFASVMHANSDIYIGGIPDELNVHRYPGYVGCISQVELMGMNQGIHLSKTAIGGLNAQRCVETL